MKAEQPVASVPMVSARHAVGRPALWAASGVVLLLGAAILLRLFISEPLLGNDPVEAQARRFVGLALDLGRIDDKAVDAYWGPGALRPPATSRPPSLDRIATDATALADEAGSDGSSARQTRLADRTRHLAALAEVMRNPRRWSFAEEASRVYDMPPPPLDKSALAKARAELAALLPGTGPLAARVDAFRARYVIPEDRREAIFTRALAECRRRTLAHWRLPPTEHIDVQFTNDVDAAWHRYQGRYRSLLQVNPQAVAFLGSALDVACHEGYPGHHAQFVLQEQAAGTGGLPIEDRIVLLRSPESLFREGAANYGVDLAFPPADRLAFTRDVLFPMAGFAPAEAERFERVRALIDRLAPASAPILAAYRDGHLAPDAAAARLQEEALIASPQPLLAFADSFGAYTLGYTVARDAVARSVAQLARGGDRWSALARLAVVARLPVAREDH